jgi:hypothetical protein
MDAIEISPFETFRRFELSRPSNYAARMGLFYGFTEEGPKVRHPGRDWYSLGAGARSV